MKSNPALNHVYINDSHKCSSISITFNLSEEDYNQCTLESGCKGSKEFICKFQTIYALWGYVCAKLASLVVCQPNIIDVIGITKRTSV